MPRAAIFSGLSQMRMAKVRSPEDVGALDAADGGELRLDDARQVVGDLVLVELARGEPEVHGRELVVRGLQLDDGRLRLRRQVVAHLRHLGLDLGEGGVGVVVELQVHGDRAEALGARRLHVVDAVRAGDHALQRGGDEAAHQVGVGADVGGAHPDDRDVAARVLPHAERADGLQPGDEDHQVDDDGQDRPLDEEIGEFHDNLPTATSQSFFDPPPYPSPRRGRELQWASIRALRFSCPPAWEPGRWPAGPRSRRGRRRRS